MAISDMFNIFSGIGDKFAWVLVVVVFALIIIVAFSSYRNKSMYRYPVRVFRTRNNGKVKEVNFKGGYVNRKNSSPFFRIKTGKWWWQYVDLSETPKIKFMDEEDRVYYNQVDVNTYIQLRREFNPTHAIKLEPVESDVKYGAILSIQRIKDVLRTESTLKKLAPYFALVIVFMAAIIGWWFVMRSKCPVVG